MQFNFVQCSVRIPKRGGAAFGDDFQPVVPGAFAQRAERGQAVFVKFQQFAGIVGGAI